MNYQALAGALALLIVANAAPILARKALGDRCTAPIDGGCRWPDGRPLLGPAKTWRGLLAAVLLAAIAGLALGWPLWLGAAAGATAMLGDAVSSFIKRRIDVHTSDSVLLLDQLPEALLPLLLLQGLGRLGGFEVVLVLIAFAAFELLISPLLYRLHIRRRPR